MKADKVGERGNRCGLAELSSTAARIRQKPGQDRPILIRW